MRCRYSAGYGRWLFGIVDAPFRPNDGVSTKPGQLRDAALRLGFAWYRRGAANVEPEAGPRDVAAPPGAFTEP
jgi:hypothetical protein